MDLIVEPDGSRGVVRWGDRRFACALGRGGVRIDKREGDGATPAGRFVFRRVLYRPDRQARPATGLPTVAIGPDDGWCDDPADARYNRPVRLPWPASAERLWRSDRVYDLILVVGHNDAPPVPGLGSGIFVHVAQPDFSPTAGCVALAADDLAAVLDAARAGDALVVRSPRDSA
ncbi:MAG: L,D-transpeptidase [Alphaproteobacteria bacterium]